jgi:hypothetical protein
VVDAQAVALRITVGEEPALEHFVRRETDAWHHRGGVESRLLHVLEIVLRVAVQLEHTHLDQGEDFL